MKEESKMPVKCSVENCQYNEEKMCQAETIEVDAMGDQIAESSLGTSCSTFKKNDSAQG